MTGMSLCLWYDNEAEEAARFYCSIFPDAKIHRISRYPDAGREIHGREAGTVMTVEFSLAGMELVALNGGPLFTFSESASVQVNCDTQEEIDYYWEKLGEGCPEDQKACGWLKDKFGLSWQVVPKMMAELTAEKDAAAAARMMAAMLKMKKLDIAALQAAWDEP